MLPRLAATPRTCTHTGRVGCVRVRVVCVFQNLSVALVLESLGATVSYVALTTALPLADFMFAWPLLMGSQASSFSVWSVAALVIVVFGLALYRSANEAVSSPDVPSASTPLLGKASASHERSPVRSSFRGSPRIGASPESRTAAAQRIRRTQQALGLPDTVLEGGDATLLMSISPSQVPPALSYFDAERAQQVSY